MTASAGRSQNQVPVVDRVDQQPVWSFVRSAFFVEVLQQGAGRIIALGRNFSAGDVSGLLHSGFRLCVETGLTDFKRQATDHEGLMASETLMPKLANSCSAPDLVSGSVRILMFAVLAIATYLLALLVYAKQSTNASVCFTPD